MATIRGPKNRTDEVFMIKPQCLRVTRILAFLTALTLIVALPWRAAAQVTLISTGAVWKYLDNGSDQGSGWTAVAFIDGSWASGPAPLGYGDADGAVPATLNSFG